MRRLSLRQRFAAISLTIVALLFISLDFTAGSLHGARGGTTGALGALYRGTDGVLGPARRFIQGIPDVSSNRTKLAQLEVQNQELRRQLTDAQVDQASAAQLKALQLQASTAHWSAQPARVIATGPGSGFQWTVTVDAGSSAQVQPGQTVTDGAGLVGRVLSVQKATSIVLLVSDPTSAVGVRDSRSGALLLASGIGASGLSAVTLASGADVKVNDLMLTGPAGSTTYVPDIAVGTVTAVHAHSDGSVSVSLRPAARQAGLDLLSIVALPVLASPRLPISPAAG